MYSYIILVMYFCGNMIQEGDTYIFNNILFIKRLLIIYLGTHPYVSTLNITWA
jgi:hypothetical protein